MPLNSDLTREQSNLLYDKALNDKDVVTLRLLCREDLFFLLTRACRRFDINHNWLYNRVREVEASPDGYLDLWAREHYKSTIITFGKTIQDILVDPDETFGIFSHTRPIAKAFLEQIKTELENNSFLKDLFPDILYQNPKADAQKWSLDGGIVVKRKSNPKEATIEAHGLVDGQPTSRHFSTLVYDDIVTLESVTSPEMINKTTNAWSTSLNLGADRRFTDGTQRACRQRYSGTRYHHSDSYKDIIDRGVVKLRTHYPTDKGKKDIDVTGNPVLKTLEVLVEKRKSMGVYVYGCQMLQDPTADKAAGFQLDWLEWYNFLNKIVGWNFYLIVDPASEKKKSSDYTVMVVIGLAPDGNYYLVDAVRDKMNLTERTRKLFELHRKWTPKATGYEKYGMQADIEHIKYVQDQEGYRFQIIELGGAMPKNDRIRRLVPIFEQHRFYLPRRLLFVTSEGKSADFVALFVNDEYVNFPVAGHDDMLDCIARITDEDLAVVFPKVEESINIRYENKAYIPSEIPSASKYDPMSVPVA